MSTILSCLSNLPASCQLGLEGRLKRLHEKEAQLTTDLNGAKPPTDVKVTSSWTNNTLFGDLDRATNLYTMGFNRVYDVRAIPNLLGAAVCSLTTIPARLLRTAWSICSLIKAILPNHRKGAFDPLLENLSALAQATAMTIIGTALAVFKLATFIFRDTYQYHLHVKWTDGPPRKVLLIIDVQNDFEKGGSLAVPGGEDVVVPINDCIKKIKDKENWDVAVSQDWHPFGHGSFAVPNGVAPFASGTLNGVSPQVFWPAHCVQGSNGAQFDSRLALNQISKGRLIIAKKGFSNGTDSYSALKDNGNVGDTNIKYSTILKEHLEHRNVKEVVVVGLATDYCVKYSALDARAPKVGALKVTVIKSGCRGIGEPLGTGNCEKAFTEMSNAGIHIADSVKDYSFS